MKCSSHFNTSPGRIFFVGFSQGATAAWSLAAACAALPPSDAMIAGGCLPKFVLLSGRLMPAHVEIVDGKPSPLAAVTLPTDPTSRSQIRILQMHGKDDDITPFSMAEQSYNIAREQLHIPAANIEFKSFEGGHEITRGAENLIADFVVAAAEQSRRESSDEAGCCM